MAAEPKINPVILNILKPQGQSSKILDKLLHWVLSSGKFVLIFVELVVIGGFIFRYQLDSKINDLDNQIDTQISLIKAKSDIEKQVRLTQFQLASIKQIKDSSLDYPTIINQIAQNTPTTTTLTSIDIHKDPDSPFPVITISGNAPTSADISSFIQGLQGIDGFRDISLSNVNSDQQSLTFSISGNLKKQGGKSGG